jgi:hypothetical protein
MNPSIHLPHPAERAYPGTRFRYPALISCMTLSGLYPGFDPDPFVDPYRAFDPTHEVDLPDMRIDPGFGTRNDASLHPYAGPEYDPGTAAGPGRAGTLYPARNETAGKAVALADDGLA